MVAILIKKLTYFRPLFSVLEEEKDIKDLIAGHKDDFGIYKGVSWFGTDPGLV